MHDAARLRLRDLTQEVYDIGDEIAEGIDNVAASMSDWDAELVADCMHELAELIERGRAEVRLYLAEINGLRQAFVSGVNSGTLSAATDAYYHPGRTLSFLHPRQDLPPESERMGGSLGTGFSPVMSTATLRMSLRSSNSSFTDELTSLAEWVVEQTAEAVERQSVLLPQAFATAWRHTGEIVASWNREIADGHPALVREMRGEAPPEFLAERARIEAIVSRVRARNRDRRRRSAVG